MGVLLGNLLAAIAVAVDIVLNLFVLLLIARAILSWVSPDPSNPIVQFIYSATDPLIAKVRQKVPPLGMFDVSVIIVLVICYFLRTFLVGTLNGYSQKLIASSMAFLF
jgi:YggT family protein